ncbi:Conserved_hypothetical protein [Hexamita inflata]|uniref:Uncharacterized protein n=1 Tax=Hexamita inflata TaxID=28002 RepID=A0AA86PED8_9EUKA|nr:Conserved hypothetical protein [Hexamita inflata]
MSEANQKMSEIRKMLNQFVGHGCERYKNIVETQIMQIFDLIRKTIESRPFYIILDNDIYCDPQTDHLEPKNIYEVFRQKFREIEKVTTAVILDEFKQNQQSIEHANNTLISDLEEEIAAISQVLQHRQIMLEQFNSIQSYMNDETVDKFAALKKQLLWLNKQLNDKQKFGLYKSDQNQPDAVYEGLLNKFITLRKQKEVEYEQLKKQSEETLASEKLVLQNRLINAIALSEELKCSLKVQQDKAEKIENTCQALTHQNQQYESVIKQLNLTLKTLKKPMLTEGTQTGAYQTVNKGVLTDPIADKVVYIETVKEKQVLDLNAQKQVQQLNSNISKMLDEALLLQQEKFLQQQQFDKKLALLKEKKEKVMKSLEVRDVGIGVNFNKDKTAKENEIVIVDYSTLKSKLNSQMQMTEDDISEQQVEEMKQGMSKQKSEKKVKPLAKANNTTGSTGIEPLDSQQLNIELTEEEIKDREKEFLIRESGVQAVVQIKSNFSQTTINDVKPIIKVDHETQTMIVHKSQFVKPELYAPEWMKPQSRSKNADESSSESFINPLDELKQKVKAVEQAANQQVQAQKEEYSFQPPPKLPSSSNKRRKTEEEQPINNSQITQNIYQIIGDQKQVNSDQMSNEPIKSQNSDLQQPTTQKQPKAPHATAKEISEDTQSTEEISQVLMNENMEAKTKIENQSQDALNQQTNQKLEILPAQQYAEPNKPQPNRTGQFFQQNYVDTKQPISKKYYKDMALDSDESDQQVKVTKNKQLIIEEIVKQEKEVKSQKVNDKPEFNELLIIQEPSDQQIAPERIQPDEKQIENKAEEIIRKIMSKNEKYKQPAKVEQSQIPNIKEVLKQEYEQNKQEVVKQQIEEKQQEQKVSEEITLQVKQKQIELQNASSVVMERVQQYEEELKQIQEAEILGTDVNMLPKLYERPVYDPIPESVIQFADSVNVKAPKEEPIKSVFEKRADEIIAQNYQIKLKREQINADNNFSSPYIPESRRKTQNNQRSDSKQNDSKHFNSKDSSRSKPVNKLEQFQQRLKLLRISLNEDDVEPLVNSNEQVKAITAEQCIQRAEMLNQEITLEELICLVQQNTNEDHVLTEHEVDTLILQLQKQKLVKEVQRIQALDIGYNNGEKMGLNEENVEQNGEIGKQDGQQEEIMTNNENKDLNNQNKAQNDKITENQRIDNKILETYINKVNLMLKQKDNEHNIETNILKLNDQQISTICAQAPKESTLQNIDDMIFKQYIDDLKRIQLDNPKLVSTANEYIQRIQQLSQFERQQSQQQETIVVNQENCKQRSKYLAKQIQNIKNDLKKKKVLKFAPIFSQQSKSQTLQRSNSQSQTDNQKSQLSRSNSKQKVEPQYFQYDNKEYTPRLQLSTNGQSQLQYIEHQTKQQSRQAQSQLSPKSFTLSNITLDQAHSQHITSEQQQNRQFIMSQTNSVRRQIYDEYSQKYNAVFELINEAREAFATKYSEYPDLVVNSLQANIDDLENYKQVQDAEMKRRQHQLNEILKNAKIQSNVFNSTGEIDSLLSIKRYSRGGKRMKPVEKEEPQGWRQPRIFPKIVPPLQMKFENKKISMKVQGKVEK